MKKKIILLVSSIVLVAAIAIGGTLAWFTNSQQTDNTVTFGNVTITLENTSENSEVPAVPGDTINVAGKITNKGNSAYVRVQLSYDATAEAGKLLTQDQQNAILAALSSVTLAQDWSYSNGYFYYANALAKDAELTFTNDAVIPTTWGNDVANKTIKINIVAQAIQSEHFDKTAVADWNAAFTNP